MVRLLEKAYKQLKGIETHLKNDTVNCVRVIRIFMTKIKVYNRGLGKKNKFLCFRNGYTIKHETI